MGKAGDQGFAHHFNSGGSFRLIPQPLNHPNCFIQILQQEIALPPIILQFSLKLPSSEDFLLQGVFFLRRERRVEPFPSRWLTHRFQRMVPAFSADKKDSLLRTVWIMPWGDFSASRGLSALG